MQSMETGRRKSRKKVVKGQNHESFPLAFSEKRVSPMLEPKLNNDIHFQTHTPSVANRPNKAVSNHPKEAAFSNNILDKWNDSAPRSPNNSEISSLFNNGKLANSKHMEYTDVKTPVMLLRVVRI